MGPHFHQPFRLRLPRFFLPLDLHFLVVPLLCLFLAFVAVVVGGQFEDPLWVYLATVVDKVTIAFDELVIDDPFWVYDG